MEWDTVFKEEATKISDRSVVCVAVKTDKMTWIMSVSLSSPQGIKNALQNVIPILLLYKHTHTHTNSHLWFTGTLHRRNGFYTVQTACAIALHLNLALTGDFSTFLKKKSLCMIYKRFELRWHRQCPHKPPSNCNTYVIIHICVLINHIYQFSHTHTLV